MCFDVPRCCLDKRQGECFEPTAPAVCALPSCRLSTARACQRGRLHSRCQVGTGTVCCCRVKSSIELNGMARPVRLICDGMTTAGVCFLVCR